MVPLKSGFVESGRGGDMVGDKIEHVVGIGRRGFTISADTLGSRTIDRSVRDRCQFARAPGFRLKFAPHRLAPHDDGCPGRSASEAPESLLT